MTMKTIAIIGSTGSIGANTLRVIEAHPKMFRVAALAARGNIELLYEQAKRFRPKAVCVYEPEQARRIEKRLARLGIKTLTEETGLIHASTLAPVDRVIFAMVGAQGLKPIFAAIQAGKSVAIANKEPLVMAGELLCREAVRKQVDLLPIDSEHSGLWQCLEGKPRKSIQKLILTSSGGPFFGRKLDFRKVTKEQALKHPKWKMGPKITIDSATLMNKGLEVIEAANLFNVPPDRIDVLIHPEAVIHALIEFVDGSQLAHLGITDMRLPIQYALGYPERLANSLPALNLTQVRQFHFFTPDRKRFPCLELGYAAKRAGGTMPAVLNAANEVAVRKFLDGDMPFSGIPKLIERVMKRNLNVPKPALNDVLEADRWSRTEAEETCLRF